MLGALWLKRPLPTAGIPRLVRQQYRAILDGGLGELVVERRRVLRPVARHERSEFLLSRFMVSTIDYELSHKQTFHVKLLQSSGSGADLSNTTAPFPFPGDPGNPVLDYPEGCVPCLRQSVFTLFMTVFSHQIQFKVLRPKWKHHSQRYHDLRSWCPCLFTGLPEWRAEAWRRCWRSDKC